MHAERKKGEVQLAKKKLSEREHAIQQSRTTLELDLESAKPLLLEAASALASVSRDDMLHLGSHKNQPAVVKLVLDSVLIVLRHKMRPIEMQDARAYRDSFAFAIEMIMSSGSWERVQSVEYDAMNGETAELLAPYLNHKDFNLSKIKSVSGPAAGLAVWVQAMARYYDATSLIMPKMEAVDEQEAGLDEDYDALAQQQDEFDLRQDELDKMHGAFEEAMANRQSLKTDAGARPPPPFATSASFPSPVGRHFCRDGSMTYRARCAHTELAGCKGELALYVRAQQGLAVMRGVISVADYTRSKLASSTLLLTGLQEERTRWIQEAEESHAEADPLAGDAGIASAMMVYLGPFGRQDRADLLQSLSALCQEVSIDFSQELHVPKFYTTQNDISSWFVQGLPCDEFSIQNGMLALHSSRFPLVIDPQDQCGQWIQQREKCPLVNDYTDPALLVSTVAECMSQGRALVYEGVQSGIRADLELVLDQIFADNHDMGSATTGGGKRLFWQGKEVEWHADFRIFFTCSIANPRFDAQLSARTSIIDFSMTLPGLEDQLLNLVVKTIDPTLETSRLSMLTNINSLRKEMDDLDKTLLQELSESDGNLLDNDALMSKLSAIKEQLHVVDETLLEAEESEADVLKAYDDHRAIAARAALLYLALQDMAQLDAMYLVSMTLFQDILTKALKAEREEHGHGISASPSVGMMPALEERMLNMSNNVTSGVLKAFAQSYVQRHQTVFELTVALRIEHARGGVVQVRGGEPRADAGVIDTVVIPAN